MSQQLSAQAAQIVLEFSTTSDNVSVGNAWETTDRAFMGQFAETINRRIPEKILGVRGYINGDEPRTHIYFMYHSIYEYVHTII